MRVLLIVHKFSPNNSVGARRWTKFYKYMRQAGTDITVLTQDWGHQQQLWGLDTQGDERIIRLSDPLHRIGQVRGLTGLVNLVKTVVGHKLLGHTDDAYRFNRKAYGKARKLIMERGITHLIVSCPPNSTASLGARLKTNFPDLVFTLDFRDAWMQAYETYRTGYAEGHPMYQKELGMERDSAGKADVLFSVVPETVSYFKRYMPGAMLLTNGFDPDDVPSSTPPYPTRFFESGKIHLCHFGTLDFGREKAFLDFARQCLADSSLRERLQLVLVGHVPESLKAALVSEAQVAFYPTLPQHEVQQLMFHADAHLVVNDDILYYAYGSKVFDAFLYRKPVVFITREQSLSNFIEKQGLGIPVDMARFQAAEFGSKLLDLLEKSKREDFKNHYTTCTQPYNIHTITKQLIDVLHQKNKP